jgi:hypothetical protein
MKEKLASDLPPLTQLLKPDPEYEAKVEAERKRRMEEWEKRRPEVQEMAEMIKAGTYDPETPDKRRFLDLSKPLAPKPKFRVKQGPELPPDVAAATGTPAAAPTNN